MSTSDRQESITDVRTTNALAGSTSPARTAERRSRYRSIVPLLTTPFVFFGHSLGAMTSFEVARRLRRAGQPMPLRMFASAHRAPHLPHPHPILHGLADKEFIDQLCRQYGGIPQAVLDNPDLVELMLPCLRADFTVFETYSYGDEAPLPCPITAFGGGASRASRRARGGRGRAHGLRARASTPASPRCSKRQETRPKRSRRGRRCTRPWPHTM